MTTNIVNRIVTNNRSIGLAGILTIIFVIAKILGYIGWSWWIVFIPIWIVPAIILGIAAFLVLAAGCLFVVSGIGSFIHSFFMSRKKRKNDEKSKRSF